MQELDSEPRPDSVVVTEFLPIFRQMFDHSPDNIVITDHLARAIYFNPTALNTIGRPLSDILNLTILETMPNTSSVLQHFYAIQAAITTESPQSFVFYHPLGEGFARPIYDFVTITPIFDANRCVMGALVIARESQYERSLEESEIQRREQYQKALLDNFPFIVWLKDKEHRFLATNSAFADVAGVASTKELEGKTDFDFFPAEMAQGYISDDEKVLRSSEPKTVIERIQKSDGEIYWAETYKSPVSINGEVIGTVGFARDISHRQQLMTEIAKKETEYSALVESLPLAIVRFDRHCRRVFINSYGNELNQAGVGGFLGKTPAEAWSPYITNMTGEEFQQRLLMAMQTGQEQTFEVHGTYEQPTNVLVVKIVPEFDIHQQVIGALTLSSDITEISQYRQRLEHLAYHDPLTDLPNRTLFKDRMQFAVAHAERHQKQFGVLLIDLDNFKSINDTLGHAVGDLLLVEAAKRLQDSVRNYDTVARMGGDEFAVLLNDIDQLQDLAVLGSKIIETLAVPFQISGSEFFISASVGIACYPQDSEKIDDLVKYADSAMYHAKSKGRNNYQFYAQELTASVIERLLIEAGLRHAIKNNELELYFQPCVDLASGLITGAEALLRWHHPATLENIGPDRFIPVAEETGMIVEIGAWVLHQACTAAVLLNRDRQVPLTIAVNLSPRQFAHHDIFSTVKDSLEATGCRAEWLKLEITESLLLQDSASIRNPLRELHELGIAISIDDFGTGYSALGYLSKFPISQVKIDRSFVQHILSNEDDAILVQAIIAMAATLRKELIAEGIETIAQAELLQSMGCALAQGYYFGKPMPFKQFEALLPKTV